MKLGRCANTVDTWGGTVSDKRHKCPNCGRSFETEHGLNVHSGSCGTEPWQDKETLKNLIADGLTFNEIGNKLGCGGANIKHWVENHNLNPNELAPDKHECPDCGDVFESRLSLKMHQRSCGQKPWQDREVLYKLRVVQDRSFVEISNIVGCTTRTASKWASRLDVGLDYECPSCDETFTNQKAMERHHSEIHGERLGIVEVKCSACGTPKETVRAKAENQEHHFCDNDECLPEVWSEEFSGENSPRWIGRVKIECPSCGDVRKVPPAWRRKRKTEHCADCIHSYIGEHYHGENHPNWKYGSRNFDYGPGWNESKRRAVRERDNRECQHCGRSEAEHIAIYGKKHTVHHIQKARAFDDPERRNHMDNLVTLCEIPPDDGDTKCHKKWEVISPLRFDID